MVNKDQSLLTERYTKVLEGQYGIGGRPVTKAQLVQLIKDVEVAHKGTNFFSITQVTKEQTNKAPLPSFVLPGLKNGKTYFAKITQVNVQVGYDYQAAANRELEKQGKEANFVAQSSIYEPVDGSKVLGTRNGQLYIRYRPMKTATEFKPVYVKAKNENPTNPDDFTVSQKSEVQEYKGATASSQTLVEVRSVSVDSIAAATIGGKSYVVSDLDPIRTAIYQAGGGPSYNTAPEAVE